MQLSVGFTVGYLVYQIGTLIVDGKLGAGFVPGLIAIAVMIAAIVYICINSEKKLKAEYEIKKQKKAAASSKN